MAEVAEVKVTEGNVISVESVIANIVVKTLLSVESVIANIVVKASNYTSFVSI